MKSITAKRAPAAGPEAGGCARAAGSRNGVAPTAPVRRRSAGLLPGAGGLGGRGASVPAIPYSFVAGHHVFRIQGADGGLNVVCHSPQSLIPSSPSTTSSGAKAPAAGRTWCAPTRNPLFLRRRAPRLPGSRRRRRAGRGAPLPAIPYSFVAKHHVFRVQGANGGPGKRRRCWRGLTEDKGFAKSQTPT